jgi:ketosteroid isomerase-like protein
VHLRHAYQLTISHALPHSIIIDTVESAPLLRWACLTHSRMNLKSIFRIVAIGLLLWGFASLVKIPAYNEASIAPKTELQKLMADKQYDAALRLANDAIRQNPQDFSALLTKGIALTAQNQRQEAIALYQKMVKDFPESAEPYNNLAALYAADGKYESARLSLEKAMQIQGSYAIAYRNLNAIYAKLADQAYNKALEAGTEKSSTPLLLSLLTEPGQAGKPSFTVAMSQFEQPKPPVEKKPTQLAKAKVDETYPQTAPQQASTPLPIQITSVSTPTSTPYPAPVASVPSAQVQVSENKSNKNTIPVSVVSSEGKEQRADKKPAPEKPSKLEKADKLPEKGEREIIDAVQSWSVAWSKQDIKAYLSHYASNFDPGNQSRSAWESDRRARIGGKARISVSVSDFSVTLKSSTSALVKFRQSYRSDRLNSQTSKTLVMERKSDGWRIVQEKAGS